MQALEPTLQMLRSQTSTCLFNEYTISAFAAFYPKGATERLPLFLCAAAKSLGLLLTSEPRHSFLIILTFCLILCIVYKVIPLVSVSFTIYLSIYYYAGKSVIYAFSGKSLCTKNFASTAAYNRLSACEYMPVILLLRSLAIVENPCNTVEE
ncbi:MAG: hypothetical protein BWY62_00796 [Firmicutes bacterium ADurb.Bin356]|nr:MAG: hypothetical protein BWY62_00796 [Firmicutes bacterium ADurb.Bin356]